MLTSSKPGCARSTTTSWPKSRILFLLAGSFTLTGTALALGVSKWFGVVPLAVGANQLLFVTTGWCPASLLIDRVRAPRVDGAPSPS